MKKVHFLLLIGCVFLIASCRKDPDFSQLSGNFVVTTNYDTSANFSTYTTYYVSDTMAYASNTSTDTFKYDDVSKQLAATVRTNMNNRGYTSVNWDQNPDLVLKIGSIYSLNAGVIYPGWWWSYPGWWDWWYPYYYPWSVAYVVTEGSVVIDMADLKNANANKQIRMLWTTMLGGGLGSSSSTNLQRAVNGINQAFQQSPQIKK